MPEKPRKVKIKKKVKRKLAEPEKKRIKKAVKNLSVPKKEKLPDLSHVTLSDEIMDTAEKAVEDAYEQQEIDRKFRRSLHSDVSLTNSSSPKADRSISRAVKAALHIEHTAINPSANEEGFKFHVIIKDPSTLGLKKKGPLKITELDVPVRKLKDFANEKSGHYDLRISNWLEKEGVKANDHIFHIDEGFDIWKNDKLYHKRGFGDNTFNSIMKKIREITDGKAWVLFETEYSPEMKRYAAETNCRRRPSGTTIPSAHWLKQVK